MTEELGRGSSRQHAELKQPEESKETLEAELEEIQSQLETDGFNSFAEMRCRNVQVSCDFPCLWIV